MKCKQCGWDNPDNRERCEKCGNLLAKQRPVEAPMPGYDSNRAMTDRTPESYRYGQAPVGSQPGYGMNMPHQPYGDAPSQPYYGYPQPETFAPRQNPYAPQQDAYAPQQDAYAPQQNPYAPQQDAYAPRTMPESAMEATYGDVERYCPECDAELPVGATECPVCHTRIEAEVITVVEGVCPDCGTEVTPAQNYCHNCGTRLKADDTPEAAPAGKPEYETAPAPATEPEHDKAPGAISLDKPEDAPQPAVAAVEDTVVAEEDDTVAAGPLAQDVPECRLRMLAADGSECDCPDVTCVGREVDLYRGNTDPANNTIARDLQARLTYADGKWSIEDCSALRTTYIRPGRSIELRDGDVIVMGNREFIFKP